MQGAGEGAAGHSLLVCFTLDKLTRSVGIGLISNMNVQGGFLDLSYLMQSSGGCRWPGAEHEEESWTLWGLRHEPDTVSVSGSSWSSLGKTEATWLTSTEGGHW